MDERRQEPRKRLQVNVIVRVQETPLQGKTIDLSPNGMNVLMFRNLPAGTPCHLTARWQSGGRFESFEAQARVVHSVLTSEGGFRVGMQFTQVDPTSRDLLSILLY